jgi:hypothetical protein
MFNRVVTRHTEQGMMISHTFLHDRESFSLNGSTAEVRSILFSINPHDDAALQSEGSMSVPRTEKALQLARAQMVELASDK